ncbi:MAG: hypothetical protein KAJ19_09455 [Gammaproteobacteria bacterium]|nr:hypothetical protein [Gammaproteobacteria bacterium]
MPALLGVPRQATQAPYTGAAGTGRAAQSGDLRPPTGRSGALAATSGETAEAETPGLDRAGHRGGRMYRVEVE